MLAKALYNMVDRIEDSLFYELSLTDQGEAGSVDPWVSDQCKTKIAQLQDQLDQVNSSLIQAKKAQELAYQELEA